MPKEKRGVFDKLFGKKKHERVGDESQGDTHFGKRALTAALDLGTMALVGPQVE